MSQPRRFRTVNAQSTVGPGKEHKTRAHPQFGVFVQVSGIDPAVDVFEMRLEVSPDNEVWAPVDSAAPVVDDLFFFDQDDLSESENGMWTLYSSAHNVPIEYVRANVLEVEGDFEVTVDLYLSGWTQRGASFEHAVFDES